MVFFYPARIAVLATTLSLALGAVWVFGVAPAYAADVKQNAKVQPGLPNTAPSDGAEAVGKLLNPQWRGAGAPLPAQNLADPVEAAPSRQGAQIYGRAERGGQNDRVLEGLLGVKFPFPAASGGSGRATTSGTGSRPF